jgi:hypothetical protein
MLSLIRYITYILLHVCWKPELWSQQKKLLLRKGASNTPVARQWLSSRHEIATINTHAAIEELLEAVFSVRSTPRIYSEDQLPLPVSRESVCRQTVSWSVKSCGCERWWAGIWGLGQFGNPEEGERAPLAAASCSAVKTVTENTSLCVVVICKV